jgi:5-(carboxyamino)imidazole ribonucleotide synthase
VKVGIIGGGQLGRMLALAGYPLGLEFRVLEPKPAASAGDVSEHVRGDYDDPAALDAFADGLDVVTYEFENVPRASADRLAGRVPVYPPPEALDVAQDRLVEKTFFRDHGIPTAPFEAVGSREEFDAALEKLGTPAVLKTRRFGYDGKGQVILRTAADADPAWHELGGRPLLLEGFVDFRRELSILSVRGRDGGVRTYPLVHNTHDEGILVRSRAPAPGVDADLQALAEDYAQRVLTELDYVGVLAIELFEHEGRLLANEMAPRVHNSGHWSIEGAETSQFENHVRAVAGLPLGVTRPVGVSIMQNLIGTVPPLEAMLAVKGAHVHLYAKSPRPGRKLGHVTVRAADGTAALERAEELADLLA